MRTICPWPNSFDLSKAEIAVSAKIGFITRILSGAARAEKLKLVEAYLRVIIDQFAAVSMDGQHVCGLRDYMALPEWNFEYLMFRPVLLR